MEWWLVTVNEDELNLRWVVCWLFNEVFQLNYVAPIYKFIMNVEFLRMLKQTIF
jgi:hypothetical protein